MKTFFLFHTFLLVNKGRFKKRAGSYWKNARGAEQQRGVSPVVTSMKATTEPVRGLTTATAKKAQALATVQRQNAYDHVLDWTPPSNKSVRRIQRQLIDPLKSATSSVFYSTDRHGKRHRGLSHVPPHKGGKPILFVSNHQLLGVDALLLVNEIYEQCQISLRPLTHPMLYPSNKKTLDGSSFFETYGCVPVSTRNFYRLLQTSQPILLFPGGIQEAFMTSQTQAYSMAGWTKDRQDFVRAAAKFNATIVPLSGIGAAESALFWQDLPLLRDFAPSAQNLLQKVMAGSGITVNARFNSLAEERQVPFPLVVPKLAPSRHYFLFGQPVDLTTLDPTDRDACDAVYRDIKQTIQQGCVDLSAASRRDLFQNPLLRVPHERMWQRQAPSFPVRLLNQ